MHTHVFNVVDTLVFGVIQQFNGLDVPVGDESRGWMTGGRKFTLTSVSKKC